jgi:hypothetical protein
MHRAPICKHPVVAKFNKENIINYRPSHHTEDTTLRLRMNPCNYHPCSAHNQESGQHISHIIYTKTVILTKLHLFKHEDVRKILCIVTFYFFKGFFNIL